MPRITIDMDTQGRLWRFVDGSPSTELHQCDDEEAEILGLTRYGAAYPGERWECPGTLRPDRVPMLYCLPCLAPSPED